jgi:hypothetical protein
MKNVLFLLFVLPFIFISCGEEDKGTKLSGIEFGEQEVTIEYGEELQLSLLPNPSDAKLPACSFYSNDEKIVSVSETGLIKGVGAGTTTVSAKTSDGEYYAECEVTVNPDPNSGLYREPYLKFGCSFADVKKNETRELDEEDDESLVYLGENKDVYFVMYIFEKEVLEAPVVVFNKTSDIKQRVFDFLAERYEYMGVSEGYTFYKSSNGKIYVGVATLSSSGNLAAFYYDGTTLSSPALRSSSGIIEYMKGSFDRLNASCHELNQR